MSADWASLYLGIVLATIMAFAVWIDSRGDGV
jgi:hypothetical protein